MSNTINGRPLPFEIHAKILTLMSLAMGTPKETADIAADFDARWSSFELIVHIGGYASGKTADISETIYLGDGYFVKDVSAKLDALSEQVREKLKDAFKVRAARLVEEAQKMRDEAAAKEKEAANLLSGNFQPIAPQPAA